MPISFSSPNCINYARTPTIHGQRAPHFQPCVSAGRATPDRSNSAVWPAPCAHVIRVRKTSGGEGDACLHEAGLVLVGGAAAVRATLGIPSKPWCHSVVGRYTAVSSSFSVEHTTASTVLPVILPLQTQSGRSALNLYALLYYHNEESPARHSPCSGQTPRRPTTRLRPGPRRARAETLCVGTWPGQRASRGTPSPVFPARPTGTPSQLHAQASPRGSEVMKEIRMLHWE